PLAEVKRSERTILLAEAFKRPRGDLRALVLGGLLERIGQVAHEVTRLGELLFLRLALERAEVVVSAVDGKEANPARKAVSAVGIERAELVLVVGKERKVERRVDFADVVLGDNRREAARHLRDAPVDEPVVALLELTPRDRQVRNHSGEERLVISEV